VGVEKWGNAAPQPADPYPNPPPQRGGSRGGATSASLSATGPPPGRKSSVLNIPLLPQTSGRIEGRSGNVRVGFPAGIAMSYG